MPYELKNNQTHVIRFNCSPPIGQIRIEPGEYVPTPMQEEKYGIDWEFFHDITGPSYLKKVLEDERRTVVAEKGGFLDEAEADGPTVVVQMEEGVAEATDTLEIKKTPEVVKGEPKRRKKRATKKTAPPKEETTSEETPPPAESTEDLMERLKAAQDEISAEDLQSVADKASSSFKGKNPEQK